MKTRVAVSIQLAKAYLENGDIIGIPTETVYGLAANARNPDAVVKIFEAKNRPYFDPLIIHTHSIAEIQKYVEEISEKARLLLEHFTPGPLTLLLPKKDIIDDIVTAGSAYVAVRIPNHPLTLELLKLLDFPLAAPSANPFGYISPTSAQHVLDQLEGKIPYVLDGGPSGVGVESTIIGFESDEVIVYRLGGLAIESIEQVVGKVVLRLNESSNPKTPGALKSHYAPTKPLLFGDFVNADLSNAGAIGFDLYIEGVRKENQILLSEKGDLTEAAKNLFAAMRKLDTSSVDRIIAVAFPDMGLGRAINDRLKRAAAGE